VQENSADSLSVTTGATGGAGGGSDLGPGAAGAAADALTNAAGIGAVTGNATATGGAGGDAAMGPGGAGGNATATTDAAGAGAVTGDATAIAGAGGVETAGDAAAASGAATASGMADASLGAGPAQAVASAWQKAGGAAVATGTSDATATALTAGGALAAALAQSSGGAGDDSASAGTAGGAVTTLTAAMSASTDGATAVLAQTVIGPTLTPPTSGGGYALATGLAGLADPGTTIDGFFGAESVILGSGAFGAGTTLASTGAQTFASTLSWDVETTGLTPGTFAIGFADGGGTALDALDLTITLQGTIAVSEDFTSATDANLFFDDQLEGFGALASVAPAGTVTVSAELTEVLLPGEDYGAALTFGVAPCYALGTRLAGEFGEVAIEGLVPGDRLRTLHAGLQPIIWIGRRSYAGRFIAGNRWVLPICIAAGALGGGLPQRALTVSPGHALYLGGALIPAWRLLNGDTITQAPAVDTVTYLHVELPAHEVIFAEGCAAESFFDDGCRGQFLQPAPRPARVSAPLPQHENGFGIAAIAARFGVKTPGPGRQLRGFIDRAGGDILSGWAHYEDAPGHAVCLDILRDGRRIGRVLANDYRADLDSACGFEMRLPDDSEGRLEVRGAACGQRIAWTRQAIRTA
jgi:hypothetical protein